MTSTTAPAPLLPAPSRPRLTRSRTDRRLLGVAGGLAEHTGIDAVLWRVAFVALTLAGGSGVLVYGLLCLLLPEADQA
ncbi:PspC domain-containing protein [Modestobacter versicolor]|uniref:Phage shock protein PspC (Stress-responsive transcriptional regulator) n=1 Tax=Modestobacter versicolor TaxID=429133 RepID=A0A323VAF4_9ACTN|nr:PspC domain-containing protein [Modestobacter versicolor]MBB3678135.1 phage shock protein PspC (stress-responsive transcriptional regulator) [Modestobacter versicolor]PZA21675.1 PspC domain-containing protein [Modestobacter versicolor]